MNKKIKHMTPALLALSFTAASIQAEPFPVGTVLSIGTGDANEAGSAATDGCSTGSCFGMEVSPGQWVWTNFGAGTDGGIVVGKNQASGGQDAGDSFTNSTPGEMTDAWSFFGAFGTFFSPMGSDNIFDNQSCVDTACDGKTFIPSVEVAWNGSVIPLGDADPINHPSGSCFNGGLISIDWQVNPDGTYALDYVNDVPQPCGIFSTAIMRTIFRGVIQPGVFVPPTAGDVVIDNISGLSSEWMPDVTGAVGYPKLCTVATQPANGVATVDPGCTFGTYQSNDGFTGADSFTYSVASGFVSDTATVAANVSSAVCESYPLQMVTTTGGGQSQTVNAELATTFVGRLTTQQGLTSGARNKVTICPGSKVTFESVSSIGSATCSVNGAVTDSTGALFAGDKLICTNKPDGADIDRFSIKSGI